MYSEKLNLSNFVTILEYSKNFNVSNITIPRIIFQFDSYSTISGIGNDSIVCSIESDYFNNNLMTVWNTEAITSIAFNTVQVNPFLKAIKDGIVTELSLNYEVYFIDENQNQRGIASTITTNDPNIYLVLNPSIPIIRTIDDTIERFDKSRIAYMALITDNEKFNEIRNAKASDGMFIFFLEKAKNYIMYLTKTIFAIKNKDIVTLCIVDDVPGYSGNMYMAGIKIDRNIKTQIGKDHILAKYYISLLKI